MTDSTERSAGGNPTPEGPTNSVEIRGSDRLAEIMVKIHQLHPEVRWDELGMNVPCYQSSARIKPDMEVVWAEVERLRENEVALQEQLDLVRAENERLQKRVGWNEDDGDVRGHD
jgi:hypothetical protein